MNKFTRKTPSTFKDLTGQKFGRLTVVGFYEWRYNDIGDKRKAYWECKCECGNLHYADGARLRCGGVKSCGCLNKELSSIRTIEMNRKTNTYEVGDKYCKCYVGNKGLFFIFDTEDFCKVKQFYWSISSKGYVVNVSNNTLIHRLITNCGHGSVVDHIDRDKLNNCKNNLRICEQRENSFNSSLSKNNTSGFTGVTYNKKYNKWKAQISIGGSNKNLGCYWTKNEAIISRLHAELKYFGEDFAPQRHLFKEYGIK